LWFEQGGVKKESIYATGETTETTTSEEREVLSGGVLRLDYSVDSRASRFWAR
jgi:hypothetical protein